MKTLYETMFLLPPAMTEEQIAGFTARLKDVVDKKQGEVTNLEKMGVRKTAYPVNKQNTALYFLIQYRGTGETIHELERMLRNSDEVMKYLSTKVTTKPLMLPKKVKPAKEKPQAKEFTKPAAEESREMGAEPKAAVSPRAAQE